MLNSLPEGQKDPRLLVGFDTSDDACVYEVQNDLVVIQTVDFFPPIVDDPYQYGQIAAANALSDIYAMGAKPSIALNILCVPSCLKPADVASIIAGGANKVHEAGAVIAGGHSVEDAEPKYGLCVSAFSHPDHIWSNANAKPGDVLILTKPLGNGILATAAKRDIITQAAFVPAIESMATLNKYARDAADGVCVNACTDITGFGFLGHASEMADASGCSFEIDAKSIPLFEDAYNLAEQKIITGGGSRNEEYLQGKICFAGNETGVEAGGETGSEQGSEQGSKTGGVPAPLRAILYDPQTSGGLLFSVPAKDADTLLANLKSAKVTAAMVGRVNIRGDYSISVC